MTAVAKRRFRHVRTGVLACDANFRANARESIGRGLPVERHAPFQQASGSIAT